MTTPPADPDRDHKAYIVLILCFMLVIAGLALGWFVTILWTILSLALSLILYIWAFHIHWHNHK